jgi:hypothetical protein
VGPTDKIVLEISSDQVKWTECGTYIGNLAIDRYRNDGTSNLGCGVGFPTAVATTDVDARFGQYRTGTTTSWASASAYFWRIKKEKPGIPVGFGIADSTNYGLIKAPTADTFTPTIEGSTGNPTTTYVTQTGRASKFGTWVWFTIQLQWSASSGGSGDFRIAGLPYTFNSASNTNRFAASYTNINFTTASATSLVGTSGGSGTSYLTVKEVGDNAAVANMSVAEGQGGTFNKVITVTGVYTTDQ